jgi:hypothetical protein
VQLKWSRNNSKLAKLGTVGFGLPAFESDDGFKVCPMAGACASYCYARQGAYTFPVVKESREFNLAVIRKSVSDFKAKAMSDLRNMRKVLTVRIHDSGDFFSQEYLDAWKDIARAFPRIVFYSYTKSINLDLWSKRPGNFRIIQSVGGLMDDSINTRKPHSRVFTTDYQRRKAGYGDGHKTDTLAIRGVRKIGLIYHGTKDLTPAQKNYLDKA